MLSRARLPVARWVRAIPVAGLSFFLNANVFAQGVFTIRPEAGSYTALSGQQLAVNVVIEPVVPAGLFSYGVSVAFDALKASLSAGDIAVPPPLSFNGFTGGSPTREALAGFAGVKGTVDATAAPIHFYEGAVVATFLFRIAGNPGDSFPLELGLFRTLGPSESVFVDGNGATLDDRLVFGSALVTIVPEPRVSILIAAGGIGLTLFRVSSKNKASKAALSRAHSKMPACLNGSIEVRQVLECAHDSAALDDRLFGRERS
jgi:hypothetical protein